MSDLTEILTSVDRAEKQFPLVQAIFQNRTPPEWEAYIAGVAARIIYKDKDGNKIDEEMLENKNINIQSGQSFTINGTKRLCAKSVDQVMTVVVPDSGIQNVGPQLSDAASGKCLLKTSMSAIAGRSVTAEEYATSVSEFAFR